MFTSANVARKEDDDSRDYFTEESTASVCFRYYLCSVFGNCETVGQMKYRNDRLITMYRIFSDYLNCQESSIFLPMENMYERENIFSENGTCTMYLKLKK